LAEQIGAIYGALATGCGYSYGRIDTMTLHEVGEVFAYWERNPPTHLMLQAIARLLGWTPPATPDEPSSLPQLAAAPPPGFAVVRGNAGLPAPLGLDELRIRNRARALALARQDRDARGR
jgi:hypothetical protein